MTIEEVLKYYGTAYQMGLNTRLTCQSMVHWKEIGYIPIVSQMKLEKDSGGALKADFKHTKEG